MGGQGRRPSVSRLLFIHTDQRKWTTEDHRRNGCSRSALIVSRDQPKRERIAEATVPEARLLALSCPGAARRFFSGALQSRAPVAGCIVWLSGSRFCAATLARCSAPGTRERPRRARKGSFKLRDVRELTTGELSSTAPESRRTRWTNACVLTA